MLALLSPLGLHIFIYSILCDGINFAYMMSVVREGCVEMLPASCRTWHGGLISKIKNVVKQVGSGLSPASLPSQSACCISTESAATARVSTLAAAAIPGCALSERHSA